MIKNFFSVLTKSKYHVLCGLLTMIFKQNVDVFVVSEGSSVKSGISKYPLKDKKIKCIYLGTDLERDTHTHTH